MIDSKRCPTVEASSDLKLRDHRKMIARDLRDLQAAAMGVDQSQRPTVENLVQPPGGGVAGERPN